MMSDAYSSYDADPSGLIRPIGSPIITVNRTYGSAVDLSFLSESFWGSSEVADKNFDLCIHIEDWDHNGGAARVYGFVGPDPNDWNTATRQAYVEPEAPGVYTYPISMKMIIKRYGPSFKYLFTMTYFIGTPSIQYAAWVSPKTVMSG
jgi:hypothetical protein